MIYAKKAPLMKDVDQWGWEMSRWCYISTSSLKAGM